MRINMPCCANPVAIVRRTTAQGWLPFADPCHVVELEENTVPTTALPGV